MLAGLKLTEQNWKLFFLDCGHFGQKLKFELEESHLERLDISMAALGHSPIKSVGEQDRQGCGLRELTSCSSCSSERESCYSSGCATECLK